MIDKKAAEKLIAEIEIAARKECFGGGELTYAQVVEKIIRKFIFHPALFSEAYGFEVEVKYHPALSESHPFYIFFTENKETNYYYHFYRQQLKDLYNNIGKVLEQTNDE